MKTIITMEAHRALYAQRTPGAVWRGGRQTADGRWECDLEPDTLARLKERAFEGETISDTIIRVCATAGKPLN